MESIAVAAGLRRGERWALRCAFGTLAAMVAVAVVATLGMPQLADDVRDWGSSLVYFVASAVIALRAVRVRQARGTWTLMAAGLFVYAAGNVVWAGWVAPHATPGTPTICDALWLSLYPLSYAGLVSFAHREHRRAPASAWMDGVVAALAIAGLGAAVVIGPVLDAVAGSATAAATNLAYPVGDLVLAALVMGMLALRGWRLDRGWGLLAGGFLLLCVADVVYLLQLHSGAPAPSSLAALFYLLGVSCLTLAAWQPTPDAWPRPAGGAMLVVPAAFVLPAIGLLVYDHFHRLQLAALALAALALLVALVRTALALRDVRAFERMRLATARTELELMRERVRLQERLRRSERLESVGQLAGGVAHDFNNLLAVILNCAELVRDDIPVDHPAHDDLSDIDGAAHRGADLVQHLLLFSQRKTVEPRVLALNELVQGLARLLERTLGGHVDLVLELAPGLGAVSADPSNLEQVVLNLVVNARDAIAERGTIIVATANVELTPAQAAELDAAPGPYVCLRVTDDGSGMDEATLAHALEPFFTTKQPGQGTGLGLSTVFGIAGQAGGCIGVESELGAGSTVSVYLPRAAAPLSPPEPVAPAFPREIASGRVLVVEDQDGVRAATARLLSRAGFEVQSAGSGAEALRALSAQPADRPFDLVLSDCVMPGMSGLELAERLRAQRPAQPVAFMSGHSEELLRGHGVDPGQVLGKPFERAELVRHVSSAMLR